MPFDRHVSFRILGIEQFDFRFLHGCQDRRGAIFRLVNPNRQIDFAGTRIFCKGIA